MDIRKENNAISCRWCPGPGIKSRCFIPYSPDFRIKFRLFWDDFLGLLVTLLMLECSLETPQSNRMVVTMMHCYWGLVCSCTLRFVVFYSFMRVFCLPASSGLLIYECLFFAEVKFCDVFFCGILFFFKLLSRPWFLCSADPFFVAHFWCFCCFSLRFVSCLWSFYVFLFSASIYICFFNLSFVSDLILFNFLNFCVFLCLSGFLVFCFLLGCIALPKGAAPDDRPATATPHDRNSGKPVAFHAMSRGSHHWNWLLPTYPPLLNMIRTHEPYSPFVNHSCSMNSPLVNTTKLILLSEYY